MWRDRNLETTRYSWYRTRPMLTASRIDYCLISQGLCHNVVNVDYFTGIKTDHSTVFCAIQCHENIRGPGYWKLNTSLLSEIDFVKCIRESIERSKKQMCGRNTKETWEKIKLNIREDAKSYSKNRTADKKLAIGELTEKITEMEESLHVMNDQEKELLENTKHDLNDLLGEQSRSLIFRSKVRWYEMGEKNSKYFYALEKLRSHSKSCNMIKDNNGNEHYSDRKILDIQRAYYQQLFMSDETVNFELANEEQIYIPKESTAATNLEISEQEIETAIKGLNNGKTPGLDGIPVEIYKMFWVDLREFFCELTKDIYNSRETHHTGSQGIINLIPKPGKDCRELKNLRPITLLNCDYKIIEKVIANRMQPVMKTIINEDQQGFMENRRIVKNIRRIFDIITVADNENLPMYILQLDWSKCFDKIESCAIQKLLEYYGFSTYIQEWIAVLYKGFTAQIQNNGHFSMPFEITRSVHQGAPCSSLIFLLCAEIFAQNMRENNKILGMSIGEFKYLLGQYADDTDMSLKYDQQSMDEVMRIIQMFKENAGFTLNYDKTVAYRVGSLRNTCAELITQKQMAWTDIGINVLRIQIESMEQQTMKTNYLPVLNKAEALLKVWRRRGLSLIGKVRIINTLIVPLFVYKMMSLPKILEEYVARIEKAMEIFLWDGHKPKIPLKVLQASIEEGGLGLVNLRTKDESLKVAWMEILKNDDKAAELAYYVFAPVLKSDIWKCALNENDVRKIFPEMPNFWRDVLTAWMKCRKIEESTFLWFNSDIRINNSPVFWKKCYEKGLKTLDQLYDGEQLISQKQARDMYCLSAMDFNQLVSACNKRKRQKAKEGKIDEVQPVTSKQAYNILNEETVNITAKSIKWEKDLECEIDLIKALKNVRRTTIIPKYRSFMYRLLQRAVVTNIHLKHWKIKDSDLCSFCGEKRETYLHLFWECQVVQNLWKEIHEYCQNNFEGEMILQKDKILMGKSQVTNIKSSSHKHKKCNCYIYVTVYLQV